jgi:hypothetical protein
MTMFVKKVQIVGEGGDVLLVNADGSIDSGTGASPTPGNTYDKKVIVVGASGYELVVNPDGSVNG